MATSSVYRNPASFDAGQYQGVTYFFNNVTNHVMVTWSGQSIDKKLKNVAETFLMSIFKESADDQDMPLTLSDVRSLHVSPPKSVHTVTEKKAEGVVDETDRLISDTQSSNIRLPGSPSTDGQYDDTQYADTDVILPGDHFVDTQPLLPVTEMNASPEDSEGPDGMLADYHSSFVEQATEVASPDSKPVNGDGTMLSQKKDFDQRVFGRKKTYRCNKCPKTFRLSIGLSQHLKRVHPNQKAVLKRAKLSKPVQSMNGVVKTSQKRRGRPPKAKVPATKPETSQMEHEKNREEDAANIDDDQKTKMLLPLTKITAKCDYCDLEFLRENPRQQHMATCHVKLSQNVADSNETEHLTTSPSCKSETTQQAFPCKLCKLTFESIVILHRHQTKDCRAKPFVCHLCTKCFRRKEQLVVHIRTHTGEKPYYCQMCTQSFKQYNHLKCHVVRKHLFNDRLGWYNYKQAYPVKPQYGKFS